MGLLRGIGYFIAIVILVVGVIFFPYGIPAIIGSIIMMWALHKSGQVTAMKNIKEENERRQIQRETRKAQRLW